METQVGQLQPNYPSVRSLLQSIAAVIDMSDPEHPSFVDSGADCFDALLQHESDIRHYIALGDGPIGSTKP